MKHHGLGVLLILMLTACGSPDPGDDPTSTVQVQDKRGIESSIVQVDHNLVFAAPVGESFELFTLDLTDPKPEQLTSLSQELGFPVWSPEGDRIAFVAMTEDSADLMLLDTTTGATSVVLPDYFELADWDRTGERLLVGLEDGLHFLHIESGSTVPVETGSKADAYGRCARNADLIAYESGRDGNPEIYVTHLDAEITTRVTENPNLDEWPSPSRDGAWIAWASGTEEDKNLWVMRSDGSEKRQITNGLLLGDAFPEWSPDGTRLLFTANDNGEFVLKLINVTSGEITDLGPGTAPSWK